MNRRCLRPGSGDALLILMIASLAFGTPAFCQPPPAPGFVNGTPAVFFKEEDPDSIVRVIVEFKEEPLFLAQRYSHVRTSAAIYQERFSRFALDATRQQPSTLAARPRAEFYKVFFGVGISVERRMLSVIERMPYVRRVHAEKLYKAFGDPDLTTIGRPEVRHSGGLNGEGVLIGIIDSGVDYVHPALGGGIGPGFKVVGGYDFVNGDSDPMDDNGHGTHVAGIAAADGVSFQGVAPKARILAYKVLNSAGQGSDLDVIAALERSADPNLDGDPADMPHILNISLGSDYGDPDDAVSTAVDNAVRLGITVCVAAGNSGGYTPVQGKEQNYYFTGMESISSPGTARLAITVGAVDSLDRIARYSSKGPSGGIFAIKPDVVAPGDAIWSLAPGGGMIQHSGTSMASPMVAGAAALLRSKDGSLSPAEIKSAIMNSSLDLGLPVFKQGAGRINTMRALTTTTRVDPGHLSFGLDDPSQLTWTKVETLSVFNSNAASQSYLLSVSGNFPGVNVTVQPGAFSIPAGGSQAVQVSLVVNNAAVPIVDEDIISYEGAVRITGLPDTVHVPWAFVRTSKLLLSFSDPRPLFLGASASYYITPQALRLTSKVRWLDARNLQVTGADNGTYDFAVYFPSERRLVTREHFLFHESGTLTINANDAIHTLRFAGMDDNGSSFPLTPHVHRTLRVEVASGFPLYVSLPSGFNSLMVSEASSRIRFHPMETLIDPKISRRVVLPQYSSFKGVAGDLELAIAAMPYRTQTLRFMDPVGSNRVKFYSDIISIQTISGTEYMRTVQLGIDTLEMHGGEVSFDLVIMKPADPELSTSVAFHANADDLSTEILDYSTRYFSVTGDSIMSSLPGQRTGISYVSPSGGTMTFGGGPVSILNLSYNNSFGPSIHFQPIFRGSLLENRYTDYNFGSYTILDGNGQVLRSGSLNASRSPFDVSPGRYELRIESEHIAVNRSRGKVTLNNTVDLTRPVPDAPTITSFAVYNGEHRAVERLTKGDPALLRFSSVVQSSPPQLPFIDSARVFFRRHHTIDWDPLSVRFAGGSASDVGGIFEAILTPATQSDSVGIDLRIRVVDALGNASDMVVAPAFAVGEWADDSPADNDDIGGTPLVFRLDQNYPNPFNPSTAIRYQLPWTAKVFLAVYDLLGRTVMELVNEKKLPGNHEVTFNGAGLASGVYFYRIQVSPLDASSQGNQASHSGGVGLTRKLILLR